jgi:hypothetical protein
LKGKRDQFIKDNYVLDQNTGRLKLYNEHYLLQPIELNVYLTILKPKVSIDNKKAQFHFDVELKKFEICLQKMQYDQL